MHPPFALSSTSLSESLFSSVTARKTKFLWEKPSKHDFFSLQSIIITSPRTCFSVVVNPAQMFLANPGFKDAVYSEHDLLLFFFFFIKRKALESGPSVSYWSFKVQRVKLGQIYNFFYCQRLIYQWKCYFTVQSRLVCFPYYKTFLIYLKDWT